MYVNTDTSKAIEREETWVAMTKSKNEKMDENERWKTLIREQRGEREGNTFKRNRMSTHSHTPLSRKVFLQMSKIITWSAWDRVVTGCVGKAPQYQTIKAACVCEGLWGNGEKDFRVVFIVVREAPKCQEKHYNTTLKWGRNVTTHRVN